MQTPSFVNTVIISFHFYSELFKSQNLALIYPDKPSNPGTKIVPYVWGEDSYPTTSVATTFLTDDEVAFVADNYNNGFPSTVLALSEGHILDEFDGGHRYITYAAYDYAALIIAADVKKATLTRQKITRYLIVNNMFAHQSGSHWISIVYSIAPRDSVQGNSHASALPLMTPAHLQAAEMNSLHSQDTSNQNSPSSFSSTDVTASNLLNDFVNHVYLPLVALRILFFTSYISFVVLAAYLTVVIHVLVYILKHLPAHGNLRSRISHHHVC
jgi:hypothetical protein